MESVTIGKVSATGVIDGVSHHRQSVCNCGRFEVLQQMAADLSVLLPGLEAAGQGAIHEQLGNSQQLLPHVPLVCCLLSPSLERSAQQQQLILVLPSICIHL